MYLAAFAVGVAFFAWRAGERTFFQVSSLRARGLPYTITEDGVRNLYTIFLQNKSDEDRTFLVDPGEDAALLRQVNRLRFSTGELVKARRPSAIYRLLKHYSDPAIFIMWIATDSEAVQERLELYHQKLRFVEPEIDGEYLKAMGLKPSPLFGHILSALRDARLDGEVSNMDEEKALVEELLAKKETIVFDI